MGPLPQWAEAIVPLSMDGAAKVLGIGRRTLVDVIGAHPHYERRGTKKVFYPEHIAQLREAICQNGGRASGSGLKFSLPGSGTPLGALAGNAYEKALALATKGKPTNSSRRSVRCPSVTNTPLSCLAAPCPSHELRDMTGPSHCRSIAQGRGPLQ